MPQPLNNLELDLQLATNNPAICPSVSQLASWCNLAVQQPIPLGTEVTLRLVDAEESRQLNRDYRGQDKPTNVLSFPFAPGIDLPAEAGLSLLGDLVICVPLMQQEAQEQNKPLNNHWAHLVIHGMLHLQGYDHQTSATAEVMESLEIALLAQLNIPNPYT